MNSSHSASPGQGVADTDDLHRLFCRITPPCGRQQLDEFVRLYLNLYPSLPPLERRRADWLMDLLLLDIEHPEQTRRRRVIEDFRECFRAAAA